MLYAKSKKKEKAKINATRHSFEFRSAGTEIRAIFYYAGCIAAFLLWTRKCTGHMEYCMRINENIHDCANARVYLLININVGNDKKFNRDNNFRILCLKQRKNVIIADKHFKVKIRRLSLLCLHSSWNFWMKQRANFFV
jgi:hypothetical protein